MSESCGYTVTAHCKPEYNFAHNQRNTDSVFNQEHIGSGEHENWIGGDNIDPRSLFNSIFKEAIEKFNGKQKRSDRKIKDYYQRVIDDGRFGKSKTLKIGNKTKTIDTAKKPIYEFIIQIGNREEHPDSQDSKKVLKSFIMEIWPEKFGNNFKLVRVDYHDDEYSQDKDGNYTIKSPAHIHVDFVPVVLKTPEQLKGKGVFKLELQHSLSQACQQAGFKTDHLTDEQRAIKNELKANLKKAKEEGNKELKEQIQEQLIAYTTYTSQQKFEENVRFAFAEHCKKNGITIDLTPGKKHSHQSKQLYQLNQELQRVESTIAKKEKLEIIVDEKIEKLNQAKENFKQEHQASEEFFEKKEYERQKELKEIRTWEIVSKTIEEVKPEVWTEKTFIEATKKKLEKSKFLELIGDGIKGFIAQVKKNYDRILYGEKKFKKDKTGKIICNYTYGTQDYTDMLLDTPIENIQQALEYCKVKNKKTIRQLLSEEGLIFLARYFKRAKEIEKEIEKEIKIKERNRSSLSGDEI